MTTVFDEALKILRAQITAYTADSNYLGDEAIKELKTIGTFNSFFLNHSDHDIHNCEIDLENGVSVHSHDDGEVIIQFGNNAPGNPIIEALFNKYKIDTALIAHLESKPGYYIAIDSNSNVIGEYKNFDEYLEESIHRNSNDFNK